MCGVGKGGRGGEEVGVGRGDCGVNCFLSDF